MLHVNGFLSAFRIRRRCMQADGAGMGTRMTRETHDT